MGGSTGTGQAGACRLFAMAGPAVQPVLHALGRPGNNAILA